MINRYKLVIFLFWLVSFTVTSCSVLSDATVTVDNKTIISENYIGNGAQWDPYQLDYGEIKLKISPKDWQKLYQRLDFMKPQFMRVMINTASLIEKDTLNRMKNYENLVPILEYCQSRNVKVMFGDWGDGMVESKTKVISEKNLKLAANYLDFLVNKKGFTCIRYYNMINEPNGYWSATNENYELWQKATRFFYVELKSLKLTDKVGLAGPDIAIWHADKTDWITMATKDLGEALSVYDIHTYPSKITVNSGEYTNIIKAYKEAVPEKKPIVMGEIGLKFVEKEDATLLKENQDRAKEKPFASLEDSQMFVYDYVYGTDMADALFQTVNSGYSGSIAWMLDDAMHSKEQKNKLKVWGFWNIFGEEYFGKKEEDVRPWYYAWSLLSKYMPTGSTVYKVSVNGNPSIKAIAIAKNNQYMLAFVNVSKKNLKIDVFAPELPKIKKAKRFVYAKGKLQIEGDHTLLSDQKNIELNLTKKLKVTIPSEALILYTNFNY